MKFFSLLLLLSFIVGLSRAFVPVQRFHAAVSRPVVDTTTSYYQPAALQRQRKSVASVQTMGLFGLGAPEIAVILVAAAFLLGPQKLAELGKDAGKIAGELKEVPKEFQQGLAEGEASAKAIKVEEATKVEDAKVEEKKTE